MSNKKQHNQQISTEEKLEFFIERAEALSRYFSENFRNADISRIGIYRNTSIADDEWKFHTLTYGLICLIRLFFLQSEPIALYPIYDVRKQKKLPLENSPLRALSNDPRWFEAIDQATTKINDLFFGIGALPDAELLNLPYTYNGKPVTRFEEFSTIMYGEIIHFNIEKHRIYKQWKTAPDNLFSNLLTDFITMAFYISLEAILPVAKACRQELQRLRGQ